MSSRPGYAVAGETKMYHQSEGEEELSEPNAEDIFHFIRYKSQIMGLRSP